MGKSNFFLSTMPLSLWTTSATWLHVEAPQKYMKNELNIRFQQKSPRAHTKLELNMLGVYGKLVKYEVHSSKRKN
jgi:hypothetical protein